jgi:hypothetical protein
LAARGSNFAGQPSVKAERKGRLDSVAGARHDAQNGLYAAVPISAVDVEDVHDSTLPMSVLQ